jgi:hypothetical protein
MTSKFQSLTRRATRDVYFRAAIWTLLGALFFSLMNAAAKYLGLSNQQFGPEAAEIVKTIPVFQIAFARYAVAALVMLPFMLARRSSFQMSSPSRYLIRTIAYGSRFRGKKSRLSYHPTFLDHVLSYS